MRYTSSMKKPKTWLSVGFDMKELQKAFRDSPDIFVPHGQEKKFPRHDDDPFQ